MWNYEKRLQFPVNIKKPDAKAAQAIISQYGGPDGEMGASMRYLSQRFTMPNRIAMGTLNDIATEEWAHSSYQWLHPAILLYFGVYSQTKINFITFSKSVL